jgi:hypothetical protein
VGIYAQKNQRSSTTAFGHTLFKSRESRWVVSSGAERIRTADLCVANALLSQLSYCPIFDGNNIPKFAQNVKRTGFDGSHRAKAGNNICAD